MQCSSGNSVADEFWVLVGNWELLATTSRTKSARRVQQGPGVSGDGRVGKMAENGKWSGLVTRVDASDGEEVGSAWKEESMTPDRVGISSERWLTG